MYLIVNVYLIPRLIGQLAKHLLHANIEDQKMNSGKKKGDAIISNLDISSIHLIN